MGKADLINTPFKRAAPFGNRPLAEHHPVSGQRQAVVGLSLQATHAFEPPLHVPSFHPHLVRHDRLRKNQEALLGHSLEADASSFRRFHPVAGGVCSPGHQDRIET